MISGFKILPPELVYLWELYMQGLTSLCICVHVWKDAWWERKVADWGSSHVSIRGVRRSQKSDVHTGLTAKWHNDMQITCSAFTEKRPSLMIRVHVGSDPWRLFTRLNGIECHRGKEESIWALRVPTDRDSSWASTARLWLLCCSQNVMPYPWEADQETSCSGTNPHACFLSVVSLECLSESWCYWREAFPDSSSIATVTLSPTHSQIKSNWFALSLPLSPVSGTFHLLEQGHLFLLLHLLNTVTGINASRWELFTCECDEKWGEDDNIEGHRSRGQEFNDYSHYSLLYSTLLIVLTC